MVSIEQDLIHKLRYGEDGKVQEVVSDSCKVMCEKSLCPISVPLELVQIAEGLAKPKPLRIAGAKLGPARLSKSIQRRQDPVRWPIDASAFSMFAFPRLRLQ